MPSRIFTLLLLALTATALPIAAAEKPNFIVIYIDDLGYGDIAPFGSTLNRTPHLDRMANEGMKLTHFYAAPVCTPARAALLTGCYPKRVLPIPNVVYPAAAVGLSPDETTVAEVLREVGYRTACIGKWHVGDQSPFLPAAQGFDYSLGIPYSNDMGVAPDGAKSDLNAPIPDAAQIAARLKAAKEDLHPETGLKGARTPPLPLVENGKVIRRFKQDDQQAIVATCTDAAEKFIRQNSQSPFFLYLPHVAVHKPLYPGKDWVGKSGNGLYSDWIAELDASVGHLLTVLRELKIDQRTLVIFTSDNGATPRGSNAPLRGHKGGTWEGGIRVPMIAWWPGTIPASSESTAITGVHDILPTFAALAGTSPPSDRKLDGLDISDLLLGKNNAKGHDFFPYYLGLHLEAIRSGPWKLHFGLDETPDPNAHPDGRPYGLVLYHLENDPGETTNVASVHPEIVKKLQALAETLDADLGTGTDSIGPGVRALGRVENPLPFLDNNGRVRPDAVDTATEFP